MSAGKLLWWSGLIVLGLTFAPVGVLAAEPHDHAGAVEIRLDNGKKWPTDEALRRGMDEIRTAMADALTAIHRNEFSAYEALSARVQAQVDYIIASCQLPEEADHQLHIVLEQILDGIADIRAASGQAQGADKIVRALDLYGAHFDHAGWQPLMH